MRRPLSGALLGMVLGLAIAVMLQQTGIWPLDRITVFLLPALVGLLGILLTSIGREGSRGTLVVALVITIPLAVWGALGLGEVAEMGQLNGGCEVNAASDLDSTNVTDTSRRDPFRIDPRGGLTWVATSPVVFDDYEWRIWTEIGGVKYTFSSEDDQNNDDGSQTHNDDASNISQYAEQRGVPVDQIRGAIIVGGDAANTCGGYGFVNVEADLFETLISQIALAVAILALIALLLVVFLGRGAATAAGGAAIADSGTGGDSSGPTMTEADTATGLTPADEDEADSGQTGDNREAADAPESGRDEK